jgi:hypothetical protein
MKSGGLIATRRSLVDRLANWDDQRRWQEFFDTYWKLIYSTARKSGLTDEEAQEVVQETIITVAKKIDKLRYDPAIGSFKGWLDAHHPRSKTEWTKLFKATFVFTGGEIVNEFLMSSGYLPGAHQADCPAYLRVLEHNPAWMKK